MSETYTLQCFQARLLLVTASPVSPQHREILKKREQYVKPIIFNMFNWKSIAEIVIEKNSFSESEKKSLRGIKQERSKSSDLVRLSASSSEISTYKKYAKQIAEATKEKYRGVEIITAQRNGSVYEYDISINGNAPSQLKYKKGERAQNPSNWVY